MRLDRHFLPKLESDVCRAFVAGWMAWRGGDMLPSRKEMQLEDIKSVLPYLTVFEAVSPDEILVRLAAREQEEIFEGSMKGRNLLDITAPEDRSLRSFRMWHMSQLPCGGWGGFPQRMRSGFDVSVEVVTLPVRPAQPDQPMQLLLAMAPVKRPDQLDEPQRGPVFNISKDYQFLDLGAGLPPPYPGD